MSATGPGGEPGSGIPPALTAKAEAVTEAELRPDGEERLRAALGGAARPGPARRRRGWVPLAAAAAVLVVSGTVGVFGRPGNSGGTPAPGVAMPSAGSSPGDGGAGDPSGDGRRRSAASYLAAAGVRECTDVPATVEVPRRSGIRAAYQCVMGNDLESVAGQGTFVPALALQVTSGLDAVLDLAERAAAQPRRTPGDDEDCPAIYYPPRELWLTLDDGRVVHWQVPWAPKPCGGPSEAEQAAWQTLTTKVVAKAQGTQVASALSLATGCPDGIGSVVVGGRPATSMPVRPKSSADVAACYYRARPTGSATLEAGARLDRGTVQRLADLVALARPDPTCPVGGNGMIAQIVGLTVPGLDPGVFVDLSGCSVMAGYVSGWWRAPEELRALLTALQADAIEATPAPR